MEKIGMFEAKTHLPEIIRKVEMGEDICLTKRNTEVAFIVSATNYHYHNNRKVFQEMIDLKVRVPLGDTDEVIEMRDTERK